MQISVKYMGSFLLIKLWKGQFFNCGRKSKSRLIDLFGVFRRGFAKPVLQASQPQSLIRWGINH
jgi:hypothetical protein